jgi:hypothetical protein
MTSSLWAEKLYPPELSIAVSPHCEDGQRCIVVLRAKNIGSAILDNYIRVGLSLQPFTSLAKGSPIVSTAVIWLSPITEDGPVSVASGREQYAYVEKVTLLCPSLPVDKSLLMVTKAAGGTTVHHPEDEDVDNLEWVRVNFVGPAEHILHLAQQTCTS